MNHILFTLLQATPDTFFTSTVEKISIVGALGFFLWYFMKELKSEREMNEKIRQAYEDKIDKLVDKLGELNVRNLDAINKNADNSKVLADVIDDLKETILKTRS